jgi:hypothetical protein
MRLFDTIARHDEGRPLFAEPAFPYLNRSVWQDIRSRREAHNKGVLCGI